MIARLEWGSALIVAALVLLAAQTIERAKGADAPARLVNVLILSASDGLSKNTTTPVIRRELEATGRFDVRVCESPVGLSASTLADFDLLVDDTAGVPLGEATEAAMASFVESGKGLVVTQNTIVSSDALRGLHLARVAPGYWPISTGSAKPVEPSAFVTVDITKSSHPIVVGLESSYRVADALAVDLGVFAGAEVIATAPLNGKAVPVLAAGGHGKGRVLAFGLGHDPSSMHESLFIALLDRGCEWAATGIVTLPATIGQPQKAPGAFRALLVTGVHDHEAAFFSLFNSDKDVPNLPILNSADAFKDDIREKYDVVIMYDFTRELDDAHKKNLQAFIENGGGVVVLHHALLNYQSWDWWIDEAAGGSYRLSRKGDEPSSAVKNDQQIFVTPVAHPITAGLGPFHIQDEAYKNLRMSLKVRPLLKTDNPTSDVNLAWLSPNERYRVVSIQLGHGKSAFDHPSYQTLIHQAVRWAAGKLN